MHCVTSASMQVLWNGEALESFSPLRGIRQGDPLSPYLFVLCIERLVHLIKDCVVQESWKPFRVTKNGPFISHVFFTDDLVLFTESSKSQMSTIQNCLDTFCVASGAKISLNKMKLFFSKNTSQFVRMEICELSGFDSVPSLEKYLGDPLFLRRLKKEHYSFITDNIRKKLCG